MSYPDLRTTTPIQQFAWRLAERVDPCVDSVSVDDIGLIAWPRAIVNGRLFYHFFILYSHISFIHRDWTCHDN